MYVNDIEIELIKQGWQWTFSLNKTVSSAYISKYRLSIFNSYDCHPCLINSISISLTYMAYKNGDNGYLNGESIEMCNEFMYLGILLNYNGVFTNTQKMLSNQGKTTKTVSSAYISKYRLSIFNSYDWYHCLINSISISLTYMAYKKLKNCYEDMFESSAFKPNDKLNWGCKIRDILCKYGFNHVWLSQNVVNEDREH
jgi:hypothetical protein